MKTNCRRCGRNLKTEPYRSLGYGRKCAVKAGVSVPKAARFTPAPEANLERAQATLFAGLENQAMARKLSSGVAYDVSKCDRTEDGDYILDGPALVAALDLNLDADFCDASREAWIWSIGVEHGTGRVVASTSNRLYQNERFRCVFVR